MFCDPDTDTYVTEQVHDHTRYSQRAKISKVAGGFDTSTCTEECTAVRGCATVNELMVDLPGPSRSNFLIPSEICKCARLSIDQKCAHLACRCQQLCDACHNCFTNDRMTQFHFAPT
jgi:hypothetical protein